MLCSKCYINTVCGCGICHGCSVGRWSVGACASCTSDYKVVRPRTQKAKGIWALLRLIGTTDDHKVVPIRALLGVDAALEDVGVDLTQPWFARPCPMKPRHGFVDSRVVMGWDELKAVLDETRAADPDGEVILMPYLPAQYNAVWVPRLFTVGEGNDGATVGRDVISLPLAGLVDPTWEPVIRASDIDLTTQDPYVEMVYTPDSRHVPTLTQLRAGPKLVVGGTDYIPTTTHVQKVITVDTTMDLLEWEALIQAVKDDKGVVVHHPGGSLTDHFSVHACSYNIPVCITFEPFVGDVIEAIEGTPPLDPVGILEGLVVGDTFPLIHPLYGSQSDGAHAVNLLLHTLHNATAIGGDTSWWLGVGVAFMLRYGALALRGEARHIRPLTKVTRDQIYTAAISHTLQRQRVSLPGLINVLRYGTFTGSIGGIKWARCGKATAQLFDAVGVLAKEPTIESAQALLRAFNFAVNQAHNGGWWLNKFIAVQAFNDIQKGFLKWTLQLAPFMWRVKTHREGVEGSVIKAKVVQWAKWTPINLTPLPITKATYINIPGVGGLAIQIENRVLKGKHKAIVVQVSSLFKHFPLITKGKLFVETTPEGLQLVMRPPHEPPIVLWKEVGIDDPDK